MSEEKVCDDLLEMWENKWTRKIQHDCIALLGKNLGLVKWIKCDISQHGCASSATWWQAWTSPRVVFDQL